MSEGPKWQLPGKRVRLTPDDRGAETFVVIESLYEGVLVENEDTGEQRYFDRERVYPAE